MLLNYQGASTGILHLGAHCGQERNHYQELGKQVLWVEANPEIFKILVENIRSFPEQSALCGLLSDHDGGEQTFYISNNSDGVSSSIYHFGEYAEGKNSLWPELMLKMVSSITLPTVRLDTLLESNAKDVKDNDFWILDLQGSELLALAGAVKSLPFCNCLLTEVSSKEIYLGGPTFRELSHFLEGAGFTTAWEPYLPHDDILFVRDIANRNSHS
jgi:FkbM family methyltransferase